MRLRAAVRKVLERERVCRVATVGADGTPHVVPVCHVLHQGRIYFASDRSAQKVHNLRARPQAAVVVDLYAEDWSRLAGVMVAGRVSLIDRGPRFRQIRRLLYQKYPQYPTDAALEEGDTVIAELVPTQVATWGLG
jgi:coenzyme F420-0:L-glutamate ligase/coenzyme F420-1:gamma-L-glutamate ligase